MERCQKIYNHPLYCERLQHIAEMEKNRIFCLHGIEHSLAVARIAYIICLENGMTINKELIYATAMLHDIGKYGKSEHDEESADIALKIMSECGFNEDEISKAEEAIRNHRKGSKTELGKLLYTADKLSRNCFNCKAQNECYWSMEKRNSEITI